MTIRETDLYEPLRDYLERHGYMVRGEVKQCDVTATKGEDLILIELKRGLTIQLLVQATRRQRITDSVYVAIPFPKGGLAGKTWRGTRHVLRRLELGLVLVHLDSEPPRVTVALHPTPFKRKKRRDERRAIIEEMAGRSGDYNRGGSVGAKLVTAYRERAIHVACALERAGPASPKELRALGTGPKTQSILYHNYYEWFDRIGKAEYALNQQGANALDDYPDLVTRYREAVDNALAGQEAGDEDMQGKADNEDTNTG